jgi:hypothetical protein
LLTAALTDKGTVAVIGETEGGWFWFPAWSLWQPWATEGLESAANKIAPTATSVLDRPLATVKTQYDRVSKHRLVSTKAD